MAAGIATAQPKEGNRRDPAFEKFLRLSPSDRRAAMKGLPPERRRNIERRMEQWQNMPPAQRRRIESRYARFQEMTPERQTEVRALFRRFSEVFPPDRRPAAQSAVRRLRNADEEQRKKLLESKRYQSSFNDEERKLIEQMAADLPDPE